ncbi:carbohydrate porin [Flavisphingomonas formosensis]|uniref:carbohydrate porin n=1 Tax=Flavisphingomonas formosensis TaxID=861534 RepID=UPI001E4A1D08|nr:carbohydrate porin [Sphingomonas formosensis]
MASSSLIAAGAALLASAAPDAADAPVEPMQAASDGTDESGPPFSFGASYTADLWSNARGGIRRGMRYLDNLSVSAEADLDRLVGLGRTRAFASLLYNNGTHFSDALVGDAQTVSNIDTGVRALRVYEAWLEAGDPDRFSVKAGLYDLNSEFDAIESAHLFPNSAHGIGTDIGQTGVNGPSIFPVTSLAVRVSARLSPRWSVRIALLDGVPGDPDHPAATVIALRRGEGVLAIAEVERELPRGKILVGGWGYSARFAALDQPDRQGRGNRGAYVRGEWRLLGTEARGLTGFVRLGTAAGRYNGFSRFLGMGIVAKGWLGGETGIALAHAATSPAARRADPGVVRRGETAIELTYQRRLTRWLTVQPDMQYIVHPGADASLRNALVFGLRLIATIGR